MADLSDAALAFAAGPADTAAAAALTGLADAELLALVDHLLGARARAHLEVLGAVTLPKAAKKAARAAAYKLKSAGVAGDSAPRAAAVDLTAFVDLDRVAVVGAPGVDGGAWLLLGQLPGTPGVELDIRGDEPPRIVAEDDLGRGRLRKLHESLQGGRAVLTRADLAVRFIDRLREQLSRAVGGLPASYAHLDRWREVALSYGADPSRCDARAALGPVAAPDDAQVAALHDNVRVGYLVPPATTLRAIEAEIGAMTHENTPVAEATFRAQCDEVLARHADAWGAAVAPEALAAMLDLDADLLFTLGDAPAAATALGLADALRDADAGAERTAALRADVLARTINLDAAWEHREAHIGGHAHH